jgi:hypothetical protein
MADKSTTKDTSLTPDPVMVDGRLTDASKVQIRDLILATLTGYDDIMRVKSGQIESGNFVSGSSGWQLNSQGNLEANNGIFRGAITTSLIKDSVYSGAYGTFVITATTTQITGTQDILICPVHGGLLNATLNYVWNANGQYKLLPGFNTASLLPYYYIFQSSGNYYAHIYNDNIWTDINFSTLYLSVFFNSSVNSGY